MPRSRGLRPPLELGEQCGRAQRRVGGDVDVGVLRLGRRGAGSLRSCSRASRSSRARPRRCSSTNGSSSTSQASWYITASACGHGSVQAWQVHVEPSSLPKGSSSTPASSACSTSVCGRSPASRAATRPASAATVSTSASRGARVEHRHRPEHRPQAALVLDRGHEPPGLDADLADPTRARDGAGDGQVGRRSTTPPRPRGPRPWPTSASPARRRGGAGCGGGRRWSGQLLATLAAGVLTAQGDQVAQLVVVELGQRGLAAAEHGVGERALALAAAGRPAPRSCPG